MNKQSFPFYFGFIGGSIAVFSILLGGCVSEKVPGKIPAHELQGKAMEDLATEAVASVYNGDSSYVLFQSQPQVSDQTMQVVGFVVYEVSSGKRALKDKIRGGGVYWEERLVIRTEEQLGIATKDNNGIVINKINVRTGEKRAKNKKHEEN